MSTHPLGHTGAVTGSLYMERYIMGVFKQHEKSLGSTTQIRIQKYEESKKGR